MKKLSVRGTYKNLQMLGLAILVVLVKHDLHVMYGLYGQQAHLDIFRVRFAQGDTQMYSMGLFITLMFLIYHLT
jgi:hypothetical protein